ncbi:MAG: hypothetical protein JNK04_17425 [Myxococcales bacterium]|nr:hypothetical protein [Myxococcales bacterium]
MNFSALPGCCAAGFRLALPVWLTLVASALVACGTAAPTAGGPAGEGTPSSRALVAPNSGSSAIVQGPPGAASAPVVAEAPPDPPPLLAALPPAIELSAPRACKLSSSAFRGRAASLLRLTPDGPAFARFLEGSVTLSIPSGKAGSTLLDTSAQGVVVRGFVDAATIELRPARAFVMAGFVVPSATARLAFTSAEGDSIKLALKPSPGVIPKQKLIEEERPCSDVGLEVAKYETKTPVFGTRAASAMRIRRTPVPLFLKPADRAPLATLAVPEERDVVDRYFVDKDRSLIAWQADDMLVFGWVSSSALSPLNGSGGLLGRGSGFTPPAAVHEKPLARLQCGADVPVIARVMDVERTVGNISAGTVIPVVERDKPFSRVEVFTASLIPDANARFFVRTAELEHCKALPGV